MKPSTSVWPRAYILQLYNQAIEQGCIRVGPLTEPEAKSLTQSFYRLRRRSDSNTAAWILPEFQLVTVSKWQEGADQLGFLFFMYDSVPEGANLPAITPVDPATVTHLLHAQPRPTPALEAPVADPLGLADLDVSNIDLDDFLTSMRKSAAGDDTPIEEL
jgi:hypothetical protein